MKTGSKNSVVIFALVLIGLFLLSGCAPKVPQLPEKPKETKATLWQDNSSVEENYHLKPEPYSLDSDQKDPELLGPQSTLKRPLESEIREDRIHEEAQNESGTFLEKEAQNDAEKSSASDNGMNRDRCISLIGKTKYEQYTKEFGSEKAALRKCMILERVQRQ